MTTKGQDIKTDTIKTNTIDTTIQIIQSDVEEIKEIMIKQRALLDEIKIKKENQPEKK